ncbi:cytochrome c1, heme protein, mitochondrial-like [Saccostrea cucullata]|uniref:cytochrome c1, heme protein, mitochondrial-like n=1 Tax=Saccostrea cuccullata TaxID=36930 RepID=UPI002ED149EC
MATVANRVARQAFLKAKTVQNSTQANFGSFNNPTPKGAKIVGLIAGATAAVGAVGLYVSIKGAVHASTELHLHPPKYPWYHSGFFTELDKKSVRRGYQVYKQVCSACHSVEQVRFREMVGVIFSEEEAKAEAADFQVIDGYDENCMPIKRPGKLYDSIPSPYDNQLQAENANNGVAPPDLSYVVLGREGGEDYIFSLLTGYCDPPAGVNVPEGVHYNPYFPGGLIAMAQALYNEIIEYDDGTPATQSQLAKDVVTFLTWAGEPFWDARKSLELKFYTLMVILGIGSYYYKRRIWSSLKHKIVVPNYSKPSKTVLRALKPGGPKGSPKP